MKERPILFSGEMVRAILEDRKTMTRRVMNLQPSEDWHPYSYNEVHKMRDGEFVMSHGGPVEIGWGPSNEDGSEAHRCPYGQPGDRLWVRETWSWIGDGFSIRDLEFLRGQGPINLIYRADLDNCGQCLAGDGVCYTPKDPWKPSIHMPRWASRILLEVVSVRVERLQDISVHDAIAEGLYYGRREDFESLWASIHGPGSWDRNDWVWVIEFKRVKL